MKLVAIYKNGIVGNGRLYPRDIRNYAASVSKEDKELHHMIMGHEKKQPTFVFSMPNRKSFAIYTFKKDKATKEAMKRLEKLIRDNPDIHIGDVRVEVGKSFTAPYEWTRFDYGFTERRLRSPLVIGVAEFEYAICAKATNKEGGYDQKWLEEYTAQKIKETTVLMARDWYGEDEAHKVEAILEETIILFKDLEYTPISYKEGLYFPAVRGTIISNRELPHFIGYKTGLGYGELSTLKEMDRRRKPMRNNTRKK